MPARQALHNESSQLVSVFPLFCFTYTAFSNVISHHILFAETLFKAFHFFVSNVLLLEVFLIRSDIPVMLLLSTKGDTGKSDDIT